MFAPVTAEGNRVNSKTQSQPRSFTQTASQRSQFTSKNTVQVPVTELMRIQQKCFGTDDNSKLREKLALFEQSKERVKKWPNTINALRKKKDESRFDRFKVDEDERRRVELDEAQYQAQVKKVTLEKANRQIYENNDRIRAFQGKLLLTDIHQEREGMQELKKYQLEVEKTREEMHHENILDQVKRGDELELIKLEQIAQKKKETHKVLKDQHDEMKVKYIRGIQEQKIEGELLKIKVKEQLEREEDAARERKIKQLQNQDDIRKGNDVLKALKSAEKQKEQLAEDAIKEHALKKENIMNIRKLREQQKFVEKQNQRQRLIDAQMDGLMNINQKRELILNKHIKEAEIKAENAEQIKQMKQKELIVRINHSRKIGDELKLIDVEANQKNDIEFKNYWNNRNTELELMEQQEKNQIRQRNQNLQKFHHQQTEDKLKLREKLIYDDMEEQQNILKKQENEGKHFGSWAERCIKEWHENGKAVGPLIKELTQYKAK